MKSRLIFGLGAAAGLVGSIVAAALVLPLLVSTSSSSWFCSCCGRDAKPAHGGGASWPLGGPEWRLGSTAPAAGAADYRNFAVAQATCAIGNPVVLGRDGSQSTLATLCYRNAITHGDSPLSSC